jgi:hypothetical protein
MQDNKLILDRVEILGGGYVWDADIFSVNLFEVPVTDSDVAPLLELRGVQQIALNAANLTFQTIHSIALIPGLVSLVLCQDSLMPDQIFILESVGPDIELVSNA